MSPRGASIPLEEIGEAPPEPTAYDGWGILPDQYLRRFADDDGETPEPVDQRNRDLPPLRPWWGPGAGSGAREGARGRPEQFLVRDRRRCSTVRAAPARLR